MEENTQLPKGSIIPADKIAFMKEAIEKLRKANRSDYDAGEFDSYNHKNEGRYKAFEEVLQWVNPVASYEEKIKVLTYDNNKLNGQVEGLKNAVEELKGEAGPRWVKADTKPERNVGVLVFIPGEDNHITSGMWDISNEWVLLDEYRTPEEEVTHWMPLPAFPEEYKHDVISDEWVSTLKSIAKEELAKKKESAAGREDAVEFAEWLKTEVMGTEENTNDNLPLWIYRDGNCYSTAKLYELFKQQKEK